MKCPHCGIEVRDNTVECGYCGGKITRRQEKTAGSGGRADLSGIDTAKNSAGSARSSGDDPDGDEEEEGGLSAILQPGEQVLIGSLSISVKKFFFHAYLTNKRIFLIDTQEKKLKVTAKDIMRDTIVGSIIEFSENSDPVLVLSIRSPDDEIKTMKIVFAQNGMDRSSEIDEWVSLLTEEKQPKKSQKRPARVEVPEPEEEQQEWEQEPEPEREPVRNERPAAQRQELHPARKPSKDHERQPPVKRLVTPYTLPREKEEPERVERHQEPVRRTQIRQVPEPVKRSSGEEFDREIAPTRDVEEQPVRKPEVQSAMKVAMKGAMQPLKQSPGQIVRRPMSEPVRREMPEPEPERAPARRAVVQEKPAVQAYDRAPERTYEPVVEPQEPEESNETPQFCHNCGKKLPHAANFCPGCGTRLGQHKAQHSSPAASSTIHTRVHEKKVVPREKADEEESEDAKPVPTKPPVKKAPKGSEMTILHKFLRR